MAFCTSCGATMDANAKFCTACGATNPAPTAPGPTTTTPAAGVPTATPAQGSNVFKIVLIGLAVVFVIVVIAVAAISYGAYRLSQNVKVEDSGDTTKVETPFGTIEADKGNSEEVARKMGVEIYPGARAIEGNTVMRLGDKTVAAANFESDDDAQKVFEFYKDKYPEARMVNQPDEEYHIMTGDDEEAVNIHIRTESGKTQIAITKFESGN